MESGFHSVWNIYCRQKILIDLALKKGYSKVMLGDCSTRLAVRLLTDIAQGRGAHVAMDTVRQKSISVNIHVDLNYFTLKCNCVIVKKFSLFTSAKLV